MFGEDVLPQLLPQTDALIMILPGAPETRHVLNAERLALLPRHAWLVNVGRGMSVDEDALLRALERLLPMLDAALETVAKDVYVSGARS